MLKLNSNLPTGLTNRCTVFIVQHSLYLKNSYTHTQLRLMQPLSVTEFDKVCTHFEEKPAVHLRQQGHQVLASQVTVFVEVCTQFQENQLFAHKACKSPLQVSCIVILYTQFQTKLAVAYTLIKTGFSRIVILHTILGITAMH